MQDSFPSPKNSGSNKTILFFLICGCILLVAAGTILYTRRSSSNMPSVKPAVIEDQLDAPAPLVVSQLTRPSLDTVDAGAASVKKDTPSKTVRRRRKKMGTIDPKEVRRFMNARFGQVKACYENRLKKNTFLEGKLDLNIGIATSGKVTSITVNKNTVRDEPMLVCVKRTIRGWDFPKPTGGHVIIAKTFSFKKKNK